MLRRGDAIAIAARIVIGGDGATTGVLVILASAGIGGPQHEQLVRRWAELTWEAWGAHHDVVRRWAADALD